MANYRVLVADDDEMILKINVAHLKKRLQGLEYVTAKNGKEALEKTGDIDFIVSDYNMPEMTGIELANELKGKIPFVLACHPISGQQEDLINNAVENGLILKFVEKPLDPEDYDDIAGLIKKHLP